MSCSGGAESVDVSGDDDAQASELVFKAQEPRGDSQVEGPFSDLSLILPDSAGACQR